jgi:hypothetical protein
VRVVLILGSLVLQVAGPRAALAGGAPYGAPTWVTFMSDQSSSSKHVIYLIGSEVGAAIVSVPGLGFTRTVSVNSAAAVSLELPDAVEMGSIDGVENRGVRITANVPVAVYGVGIKAYGPDGFLGLPAAELGTEYRIMSVPTRTGLRPHLWWVRVRGGWN